MLFSFTLPQTKRHSVGMPKRVKRAHLSDHTVLSEGTSNVCHVVPRTKICMVLGASVAHAGRSQIRRESAIRSRNLATQLPMEAMACSKLAGSPWSGAMVEKCFKSRTSNMTSFSNIRRCDKVKWSKAFDEMATLSNCTCCRYVGRTRLMLTASLDASVKSHARQGLRHHATERSPSWKSSRSSRDSLIMSSHQCSRSV